jgi:hypothetical protein
VETLASVSPAHHEGGSARPTRRQLMVRLSRGGPPGRST